MIMWTFIVLLLQKVFDAEYYSHDIDKRKPVFTDDEIEGMLLRDLWWLK